MILYNNIIRPIFMRNHDRVNFNHGNDSSEISVQQIFCSILLERLKKEQLAKTEYRRYGFCLYQIYC